MKKTSTIQKSFTLVELLVTISLAALILGIGIPSFISITRGAQAKEANNMVQAMLKQAQQQAMITRQQVAFYIVTRIINPANQYVSPDMVNRSFFLYATQTRNVSHEKRFLTSVQTLPTPMVFDMSANGSKLGQTVIISDENGKIMEVQGFRFIPAGGIFWDDAQFSAGNLNHRYHFDIVIQEGKREADGSYTPRPSYENPIVYTNSINVFTGRLLKQQ